MMSDLYSSILLQYVLVFFFFFFQAEDGIRDVAVTGVQTCALPICTAIAPALPVAPRTRTLCPGWIGTRRRRATHDDIAGFIAAATFAASASSGDRKSVV